MPETYTIAAAARLCGVTRRTLQQAIQAGRLTLTPDYRLTREALVEAGYVTATDRRDDAVTPATLSEALAPLLARLDRLIALLEARGLPSDTAATPQRPTAATPQQPRGGMRREIVALLAHHPQGLTAPQIQQQLGSAKRLNNTLTAMARDGLLTRLRHGTYALPGTPA